MEARVVIKKEKENDFTLEEILGSTSKFDKIYFNDSLDYVEAEKTLPVLLQVKTKLNQKGRIIVQGYDIYELSYSIVNDRVPTIEYNAVIKDRKQLLSIPDLMFIFNHLGLKIVSKDIDSLRFLVEAQLD